MRYAAACLLLLVGVGGCLPMPPAATPPTDDVVGLECEPEAWAPFDAAGTGTIEGQAFLRTRGGEVRVGAGSPVLLIPAVRCVYQWWPMAGSIWAKKDFFPSDAGFRAHRRETVADAEGRFRFPGLPAGAYFVRSQVVWEVPDGNAFTNDTQGGIVGGEFTVKEGSTTTAMLTWK